MSEQTYYESGDYGDYGYVTLEQVVTDYMADKQPDDYDAHVPRYMILSRAKRGLRQLYYDALREIRAIEMDIGPTLSVPLPPDYVNYARISWVDDKGKLYPITENRSLSISRQYLQDNDFNILFDESGNILQGTPTSQQLQTAEDVGIKEYCFSGTVFAPNVDRSETFPNGGFRIDKEEGVIRFSSEIYTKSIVIEYISDGLYFDTIKGETDADARVHKFAEEALHSFIYYKNVWKRRNVPRYAQKDAKDTFYNEKRLAKRRLAGIKAAEIKNISKGADVWIKGSSNI